jgi:hypothetical protein
MASPSSNPQIKYLLDKRLVSLEIAQAIWDECGENDIGLFLGHLLYTSRISASVVQTYLDRSNVLPAHLQWES